jgi:hypothetical protein
MEIAQLPLSSLTQFNLMSGFGSKADIEARQSDVRFTPESGHGRAG